jgi:SAM-dependent methyltransferase
MIKSNKPTIWDHFQRIGAVVLFNIVDKNKLANNYILHKYYFPISRFLAMKGINNPFKKDQKRYWSDRNVGDTHGPENYIQEDISTHSLFEDVLQVVDKNASFLEIGCNAGRNLNYLYKKGFRDLAGIEINRTAINETLKNNFPELYNFGQFFVGSAAEEIKKISDKRYDVVFANAVLEHIPPKDISLFKDMVRVSKKYIVVLTTENSKVYAYDFNGIFEKNGCKTILFKLYYGDNHKFLLPTTPYNIKNNFFSSVSKRVFIKNKD